MISDEAAHMIKMTRLLQRQLNDANLSGQHLEHLRRMAIEAESFRRQLAASFEPFRKMATEWESIRRELIELGDVVTSTWSDALRNQIRPLTLSSAYIDILRRYEHHAQDSNPEEALLEEIESEITKPTSPLRADFYLHLIVALILFFLGLDYNTKSEERIMARIENHETYISEKLEEIRSQEKQHTFYIVQRPVNLRSGPSTRSKVLSILYPNLKVKLIERRDKWIKIEYFDYVENIDKSGWVYKKYLRIINPEGFR